jgi:hypothetical protein
MSRLNSVLMLAVMVVPTYTPMPLGAIKPAGWLRRQLELQASGLTGHLDEFWSDVGQNSGWLGGTGESWERGPYYLDGLLPLAYELDNSTLKKKAQQWVDWTLAHQRPDGQIGPVTNDDWWPRMVMLKVLTQYAEASGDARVVPLMEKYFHFELTELPKRPLRDWGKYRWQDNVYSVLWLYRRTEDPKLIELARLLHQQGFDWEASFAHFKFTGKESRAKLGLLPNQPISEAAMQTHGVNNAMALKAAPIWWLVTGNPEDRAALAHQLLELDRYQGLPNGMFSGDEHFAGRDPSQGIELCAVVETMFSLEDDFAILGDAQLADRLERVAYNALPATLSNDMWSHQYDQQPNQIACTRARREWSTNGDDANLFGLAPNFGCCTANLHQGWPKFVESLWMKTSDSGLVAVAYAPNRIDTVLKGVKVSLEEQTNYPFTLGVHFVIHPSKSMDFPLVLRVPGWSRGLNLRVNGKSAVTSPKDSFVRLSRTWKDGDTVDISFDSGPRVSDCYHKAQVFERGPLVFALPLDAQWKELKHYAEKSSDWQLEPTAPWNFAVGHGVCGVTAKEHPVPSVPFDRDSPAVTMQVAGRRLASWTIENNSAGPVPLSPVSVEASNQELTLIPYGAAKLRVTAFPWWPNGCSENALLDSK